MTEEIDSNSEVILEIEDTPIKCNKQKLIENSDYFKVMFEGNFIERDKKVVKLEGICLDAMNIILTLLWDDCCQIEERYIISVLQASCMLQFVEIKRKCITMLLKLLSPKNCIKIWLFAEQYNVNPLYLKAKKLALVEFAIIKDEDEILQLEIKQLYSYLANTNLQCQNELDVFQVCMKWWYENSEKFCESIAAEDLELFRTENFLHLLSCLDFKKLLDCDIQEMMTYPDLSLSDKVMKILQCIIDIRQHSDIIYDENIVTAAQAFCNSKSRTCRQCPCILVHSINDPLERKRLKLSIKNINNSTVYCDMWQRKRHCTPIGTPELSVAIAYYDKTIKNYEKLLTIGKQKCQNLDGYKILGYKEFVFLFGGEFFLGKGGWNNNFWVYDTIREFWERKSVMPYVRRHFQSCLCGNYLFVIGGTGNFRVIQDNMFWYNYKKDEWSEQIKLPCAGRQLKCCSWNNQLLLLNINDKCGYIFDMYEAGWPPWSWRKVVICDNHNLVYNFPDEYAMFSYKNSLYVKGECLIEMKVMKQQLLVIKCAQLETLKYDEIESVLCENLVYTLYKQTFPEGFESSYCLSFEKYDMDTQTSEFIFKDISEETVIILDGNEFVFRMSTTIFGFQHYQLIATDNYVNDF